MSQSIGKKYNPRVSIFRAQTQMSSNNHSEDEKKTAETPQAELSGRHALRGSENLSASVAEESKGSPLKRSLGKPILKKSRFAEARGATRNQNSSPQNRVRITIREQPIIHEVESWKKYNVPMDEQNTSSCTCSLM
eukprot:TRINITY_DN2258_c0_g1_i2.p1 TRINITY_DN2258_c0_g1~~TRINITY_DN2258_c0_g1_i2.p1  ORF type:complete len:136 (+),score=29.30 TRINITY_DN2258_c0_g1_i2:60-467(+)